MAPRTGLRVKIVSPNSGEVTVSRSVSIASSLLSSGHASSRQQSRIDGNDSFRRATAATGAGDGKTNSRSPALQPPGRLPMQEMQLNTATTPLQRSGMKKPRHEAVQLRVSSTDHTDSRRYSPRWQVDSTTSGRVQHEDLTEDDDRGAVQRAQKALEAAGGSVLKRPLDAYRSALALQRGAVAAPAVGRGAEQKESDGSRDRPLHLPRTIPITRDSSAVSHDSSIASVLLRHRSRSTADAMDWAAINPSPRRDAMQHGKPTTHPSTCPSSPPPSLHGGTAAVDDICPGMWSGLSAIALSPTLFDGAMKQERHFSSAAAASPGRWKQSSEVGGAGPLPGPLQQRYGAKPLWSLVGTFKTALNSMVAVDYQGGCLKWNQRNPSGQQQCIKMALDDIVDVFTTRVVQEDECIQETQHTVVVRASGRPSQAIFGFTTMREANQLRAALKRYLSDKPSSL